MEDIKLIPRDVEKATELENKLKKSLALNSSATFIVMYNAGYLSTTNQDIKDISKEIEEVYKNVEVIGRKIVIIDEDEVTLRGIQLLMSQAMVAIQLKRLALSLVDEGYSADDHIFFSKDYEEGKPVLRDEEKGYSSHWMFGRKMIESHEEILGNVFLKDMIRVVENNSELVAITILDLVQLNTDFIKDLQQFIAGRAL